MQYLNRNINVSGKFLALAAAMAFLLVALITPFSASAASSTLGSISASQVGAKVNITGCKVVMPKGNTAVTITAVTASSALLKYRTLTVGTSSSSSWVNNSVNSVNSSFSSATTSASVKLKNTSGVTGGSINFNPKALTNC